MDTTLENKSGHTTAVAEQPRALPKWAALITDLVFPMPRQKSTARDILDQAGIRPDFLLVRDFNGVHDFVFDDDTLVDLAEGNVFRTILRCDAGKPSLYTDPPKLAFVCDDAWEVTITGKQTGHSLKRLFGLPDETELLRDYESPHDVIIGDSDLVNFAEGNVFTSRSCSLTIKVNNRPVQFKKCRVTGMEIKQTAIEQGVKIDLGCVLYPLKPDGGLGQAIRDDEFVILKPCDAFNCVAPDDNS